MYSIPQHAVTKGYWKIEYFRAQPMASSSLLVKNVASFISLPLQSAVIPCVNETDHQDSQKDAHFGQARRAQSTIHYGPGIQEDEFDVEQNEEDGGEIELDRQSVDGQGGRLVSALERSQFDGS